MDRIERNADYRYPTLRGRRSADVLIIGGGLSGMHTALLLGRAGLNVIVLEADRLFSGASGYCAGIVTGTNGAAIKTMVDCHGAHKAKLALDAYQSAMDSVRALALEGCDWKDEALYWIAQDELQKKRLDLQLEAAKRAGLGVRASGCQSPLPAIASAILPEQGSLNTRLYENHLLTQARKTNCRIYEGSRVIAMEAGLGYTQTGSVRAPYIVVATGYPILTAPGYPFLKLDHISAARLIVDYDPAFEGMYMTCDSSAALRRVGTSAVLAIDLGRAGCKSSGLDRYTKRYQSALGGAVVLDAGASEYVKAVDGLPKIGAYSKKTPNLFIACGYDRQGLVGSMTAAQAISARVLGLDSAVYKVFEQRAHTLTAMGKVSVNALGQAGRYAIGMTRIFAPRCPHMGCKLRYVPSRHGWVCPCHGSAFDDLGQARIAPTVYDARIKHRKRL